MPNEKMIDISETDPVSPSSGKWWIDSLSGQVWMWLGNKWQPFAGGEPGGIGYEITNPMYIMNGDNVSEFIAKQSLRINNVITSEIDTANFVLQDMTIDGRYKPLEGCNMSIFKGDIDDGVPEKIFGGVLISAPQRQLAIGKYKYDVNCLDYSKRLNNRLVLENFTNQTAKYIIEFLVNKYMPEFTTANVQTGDTIPAISFNYKLLGACIKQIADETDYEWYVDYNKDIHFFSRNTNIAPYELNETATSGRFKDLEIDIDISQIRNYIIVRGGYYLSNLYTQTIVADGEQLEFNLGYSPYAPISVKVNTVSKTLAVDNFVTSGYDFVVNFTEKIIKNLDYAKLSSGDKLTVSYKYKVPILVLVSNQESINQMKAIEGGDGNHEYIINDTSIVTLESARNRGQAELSKFAFPHISGSFETDQSGYKAGQLLTINIPTRQIDTQCIIQKVTANSLGLGNFFYEVEFSTDKE